MLEIAEMKHRNSSKYDIFEKEELLKKIHKLSEANPMLGHRGCRLGLTYPEIYIMQARAIFEAMCLLKAEGVVVFAEIEIPLVMDLMEFSLLREDILAVYEEVKKSCG